MNMKDIEKEILGTEKNEKAKIDNPLKEILEDEDKVEKIINATVKSADKEGLDLDEDTVRDLLDNFWGILSEEIEYVPGYIDEYIDKVKELFYSKKGVSTKKISEFIINKYLE